MKVCELRVNRELIDPSFEGYKLQTRAVEQHANKLDVPPLRLSVNSDQYSFLHTQMFLMQNHLCTDPWQPATCYYVNDQRNVLRCAYDEAASKLQHPVVVCQVPTTAHQAGDYNCSLHFVSEQLCVFCDGASRMYIFETGARCGNDERWQQIAASDLGAHTSPATRGYMLYDARLDINERGEKISVAFGHVTEKDKQESGKAPHFCILLTHAKWTRGDGQDAWQFEQYTPLELGGSLYYCAFEQGGDYLVICAEQGIRTRERVEAEKKAAANQADSLEAITATTNGGEATPETASSHDDDVPAESAYFDVKLEDCDYPLGVDNDVDLRIERYHIPTADISHAILLGSTPPIFTKLLQAGKPPAFVTNYDFNAAIWTPAYPQTEPNAWSIQHEGTLSAFSYVQASKSQKKYVDCAPDLSFAIICESRRYTFIYKCEKSKNFGATSIVELDEQYGEILGISTNNKAIILLTENAIICIKC